MMKKLSYFLAVSGISIFLGIGSNCHDEEPQGPNTAQTAPAPLPAVG